MGSTRPLLENRAWLQTYVVRRRVGLFCTRSFCIAVVQLIGLQMHRLLQSASISHIDFLKAATYAQQRHTCFHAGSHQGQCKFVTG